MFQVINFIFSNVKLMENQSLNKENEDGIDSLDLMKSIWRGKLYTLRFIICGIVYNYFIYNNIYVIHIKLRQIFF